MIKKLLQTFKLWLLIVACIAVSSQVKAQYTVTTLETGKVCSGITKDAAGNIYVVRGTGTTYEVIKYTNGNPATIQVIYSGLEATTSTFPWGIAVNATGDVFITNPLQSSGWQIIKLAAGTYTSAVIHSGNFYSALAVDGANNLLSLEYDGASNAYQLVRYTAGNETGAGTVVWNGLAYPSSDGTFPWGMVVDASNNIYLTDFYRTTKGAVIKLIYPGYSATTLATGRNFSALAIDGSNNLYTAESVTGTGVPAHIMKYNNLMQGGTEVAAGLAEGSIISPWGLTVSNGTIYAGDGVNMQVLKITPSAPTPASVVATSILDASPTKAGTVRYSITFDKAVSGVTASSFSVSGVTGASVASVTGGPTTYTVTANTGTTASGTLTFSLLGNAVNGISPAISNAPFTSPAAYTIDKAAPIVDQVNVPPAATYKDGDLLSFQVVFNENIAVTGGIPSLDVIIGSTTRTALLSSVTGGTTAVFNYTLQQPDLDNDGIQLGPITLNGSTITDMAGNNATLTLNGVPATSGILADTKHPTPTITATMPSPVTGAFTITITFDEPVTDNPVVADLNAPGVTVSNVTRMDAQTFTALLTPPPGTVGNSSVSLSSNAVHDAAGNGNLTSNTYSFSWDEKAPALTITPPASKYYKAGDVFSFTIKYDENVTVTGALTLPITIGGNTRQATYTAGPDARTLIFNYTVAAGEQDLDGIDLEAAIALNGGAIKDAAGNDASTGVANHYNGILVDAVAPVITAVAVPLNGYYHAGQTLDFIIQTSEDVIATGTPNLNVNIGGATKQAGYTGSIGTNKLSFSYTVAPGDNDMDGIALVDLNLNGGTIKDAAGNNMDLTLRNPAPTTGVLVSTTAPSVTLSSTANPFVNAPFTITATFSEAVTGVTLIDFVTTNATLSNLSTSDNITYTVLVTPVADGPVSLALPVGSAVNVGGNPSSGSNTLSYTADVTPPTVTFATVPTDGYYNAGSLLHFNVAFNEPVIVSTTGGTPSLPITIGSTTVNAPYISGSGTSTLTFNYIVQNGEMDLDGITLASSVALNGGVITDNVGNNAILTLNNVPGTTNVRVNTAQPSVTVSPATVGRVNAPFTATITFSEAVTGFTVGDVSATNGTVSTLQTTDNITYTVQVTPIADGAISISIPAAAAVNIGNNDNTASNTLSATADFTAPLITTSQRFSILANSAVGTTINTARATDASGIIQNWAIAADPSGGAFAINATTGEITVNNTAQLNNQSGNTITLTLTVSDGLNTSVASPVIIDVLPLNQAPTLNPITSVTMCANTGAQTIQLTGASAVEPTQTYTLSVAGSQPYFDVLSVTNAGILTYQLKPSVTSGQATITVTIQDNGGTANGGVDKAQQQFTITINPVPVITIASDKGNNVSKGDDVRLTAAGGATYNWDNAAGIVSGQQTAVLEIRPQANTTYQVTATSANGCTSTASINIVTIEDFKVDATNILTPNGDGKNDRWVIRNIDSYPDNELKIFDRAGRLIYSQRNYNNTWNGTLNGHPLAEGTYYYFLSISGGAKTAKGYITIMLKAAN